MKQAKQTCRRDAEKLLLTSSVLATTIVENMDREEAMYLAEFLLNLGSNILFLCRYPYEPFVLIEE